MGTGKEYSFILEDNHSEEVIRLNDREALTTSVFQNQVRYTAPSFSHLNAFIAIWSAAGWDRPFSQGKTPLLSRIT